MTYPIYIYKIFWSDCDDFYIGSTKQKLCRRITGHRTDCRKGNQSKLYKVMREKGTNSFQYVLISTHTVCSKDEQRQAEQQVIDELNPTLNTFRAFITEEGRKQRTKEYQKEYNEENKEKIKQRRKEYVKMNRERLNQKMQEYRETNKQKILQTQKEKIQCECGTVMRKGEKSRHLRSKKHQFYESIYNFIYS